MVQSNVQGSFRFPYCPVPPDWRLDWEGIEQQFSLVRAMVGVKQEHAYHAEGDVLTHTRMVVEALVGLDAWRTLAPEVRTQVFVAALLHDVAKPLCTRVEEDGRISSRGHGRKGESMVRRFLWSGEELAESVPFVEREQIARMVRFHGLPLHFLDRPQPERLVIEASMSARLDLVALLSEADVRGRICGDQAELLERIELFREFCREQDCYDQPRRFTSDHSRFVYFQSEGKYPEYEAYDDTTFEVVLMAGLPGAGKDTWVRENLRGWPVISLDEIRKQLRVAPEGKQGVVVQEARERARVYMRQRRSFVWNATNVTRLMREQLVSFFMQYGARVRIVYLDAPWKTLLQRNRERVASVPESVIDKLLDKLEVPDLTEAQVVMWEEAKG